MIQHFRKSKSRKSRYTGTLVAVENSKDGTPCVTVGWAKCHNIDYEKYLDEFNGSEKQLKKRGIEIASIRAAIGTKAVIAESLSRHLGPFIEKTKRQKRFKGLSIVLCGPTEAVPTDGPAIEAVPTDGPAVAKNTVSTKGIRL